MADFQQIKQEIDDNVNTNGVGAITGAILNTTLNDMVDAVNQEKQDTIADLATIEAGAAAGATAYQKPSTGIPASDLASGVIPDVSGKADKVTGATVGDFAGLDSNGNLTDSGSKASDFATAAQGGKADTAVQQVMVGTTTTGAAGTNASVTNSGTATNPVLNFTIPRGAKGVSPFKGWFNSLSELKAVYTAVNGDYAYVVDQSPATTVSIYAYDPDAATDNYWSDTGIDMSITDMESIFSFSAKNALLDLLGKVAYIDQNGSQYIDALRALLYGEVLIVSISATYDQGDDVVFTSDSLAKLRNYLTVTATYSNGSTGVVDNYELSGTLSAGANTITVTCEEVSTTFSVTAVDVTGYTIYDYVAAKTTYSSGSIVRNIRLKQYPNLNVLSCRFKCKPIANHIDGHNIFGARTTGATTHTNSYAFYVHTGALGYHLHGMEATAGVRPAMNEGQTNIVEYINTTASPSEVVTNSTNHQQITWDNNNVLNLKPSLFYNTIDETNGAIHAAVEMGWLIFLDLNGDKVGHYLPAVRNSDSVIGMLDISDGTFYTAATTVYATIGNSNCLYKVGNW